MGGLMKVDKAEVGKVSTGGSIGEAKDGEGRRGVSRERRWWWWNSKQ